MQDGAATGTRGHRRLPASAAAVLRRGLSATRSVRDEPDTTFTMSGTTLVLDHQGRAAAATLSVPVGAVR